MLTDFAAWFDNVVLFHANRPAHGASIYNLVRFDPTLMDVPLGPLAIVFPVSLLLCFLLVGVDRDASQVGLFKKLSLTMLVAVFFNKVVLFYALWFVPLLCIVFAGIRQKRTLLSVLVLFFTLQASLLVAWYFFQVSTTDQNVLAMACIYFATSGLLLVWLLRDRLLSVKKQLSAE